MGGSRVGAMVKCEEHRAKPFGPASLFTALLAGVTARLVTARLVTARLVTARLVTASRRERRYGGRLLPAGLMKRAGRPRAGRAGGPDLYQKRARPRGGSERIPVVPVPESPPSTAGRLGLHGNG